jgi:hypothetical protein
MFLITIQDTDNQRLNIIFTHNYKIVRKDVLIEIL